MEDNRTAILTASDTLTEALGRLADFFGNGIVYHIYLRTQVIHRLFEKTPALDPQRLALHHLQFTDSIVVLLTKIRAANEKSQQLVREELASNEALIDALRTELAAAESYAAARQRQSALVNAALFRLYENLSDLSREEPFAAAIDDFGRRWSGTEFAAVSPEQLAAFTTVSPGSLYRNSYGAIDKKLLGQQCKTGFQNHFVFGLATGDDTLEIYRADGTEGWLLFWPRRRLFLPFDPAAAGLAGNSDPDAEKALLIQELQAKNLRLRASEHAVLTALRPDVLALLNEYLDRINAMNFLDLRDYEIQANILRTMLDTEGL